MLDFVAADERHGFAGVHCWHCHFVVLWNGHQCLSATDDFLVVGAYPPLGTYDECTRLEDRPKALKTIPKVPSPRKDPVYGSGGALSKLWKKAK